MDAHWLEISNPCSFSQSKNNSATKSGWACQLSRNGATRAAVKKRQRSHDQDWSDIDGVSSPVQFLQVETAIKRGVLILPESIPQLQMGNPDRHLAY